MYPPLPPPPKSRHQAPPSTAPHRAAVGSAGRFVGGLRAPGADGRQTAKPATTPRREGAAPPPFAEGGKAVTGEVLTILASELIIEPWSSYLRHRKRIRRASLRACCRTSWKGRSFRGFFFYAPSTSKYKAAPWLPERRMAALPPRARYRAPGEVSQAHAENMRGGSIPR